MARGKKREKILTLEEKLQEAIVPENEQPHELPDNWRWVTFSSLIVLISGRDAALSDCNDQGDGIPYILGASNLDNNSFSIERWIRVPQVVSLKGDILLSVKGTIGKLYLQNEEAINISRQIMAIRPCNLLNTKYTYYLLMSICEELKSTGNGLIPGISRKDILERPFPLPPLPEQQRIVDRIESLFAKLDEAKEKAQAVVDGFEDRKAAILHKAFTGELTERWRRDNGVGFNTWQMKTVDSVCNSLKYGTAKKSEKNGDVVVIRMGNLQQGEIDWRDLAYTSDKDDISKYHLEPNDVLFNRTNSAALVGKTSIYRGEYPAIYAGYLIKLDYDHSVIIGDYLNYALNTQHAKEYCNAVKTDGVNQSNINAKKIGAYGFPVPSIKEQKKIVEILRKFIGKECQAKESAEQVIVQIDIMKKSILARAFRGELGTNDPSDESAEKLLIHDRRQ